MNRKFVTKLTILVGALATALVLTIYKPSPLGLSQFGVERQTAWGAAPQQAGARSNYNLTALKVFNVTLVRIRDNYVDPTRIDPKQMLFAALDSVQRNVPEILVETHPDTNEVVVTVNDKSQTFGIGDVDSPWKLSSKLKEIFRFVQASINPGSDPAKIEYAAVNGMLGTLDPHSVLLDPDDAREMDINTTGKFGGIGITIGMRKGKLTVINLISPDTPAAKVGLKPGDHIVKINDEPTVNLTLNEAMNRLRGDPNTRVVVVIERPGVPGQTTYTITRDVIRVSSVEGRLLKGNVGYLKIDNFSQETARDLQKKVAELKKQGAKAWVLDLRWNPGGLLEQAIKVTDLFVDSGTIVTTVGYAGKQREEKRAQVAGTEAEAPLAVLVNGGSASASEIVAGALKNLNRAVIIGQTTFGKGSVQVLFDNDDGSKLKLTIAQYLTPGDVSIQSVGIAPDIELIQARVPDQVKSERDQVRLLGLHITKEADLDAHLTSRNARKGDKPSESLRYLYVAPKGQAAVEDEDGGEEGVPQEPQTDGFHEDFEIQFARDLVASASANRRTDLLAQGKKFIQQRRHEEEVKIAGALAKIGVDWNPGQKGAEAKLAATFSTDKPQNRVAAGDVVAITGSVTNSGTGPAFQVHAHAKSDDYVFDDVELVFGKINPGETKSFTTYVKVDKNAATKVAEVEWEFTEANGARVESKPLKVVIEGLPRPQFAYTYQLIDDSDNGDGLLQLGESFRLHVTVRNAGQGKSHRTTASLRNASGDGVIVNKGRFEFEDGIPAGDARTLDFTFDVKREFRQDELVLELTVYDSALREGVTEKLKFPLREAGAGPQAASGMVKVKAAGVPVREGAAMDSPVIGTAKKGALFRVTGKLGDWVRVEVEPGRPGFLPAASVASANGAATAGAFAPVWQVTPPTVTVQTPSLETTDGRFSLKGTAADDNHVEDVYILVSNRQAKIDGKKVFYRSNRGARSQTRLDFSADIPVWPGNNMVTIVARENNEVRSTQTIWVYRAGGPSQRAASVPRDDAK